MKRIKYLALAALVGVWACSSDSSAPEITGTITGSVSIEGVGEPGITVTLSSGASTTTVATSGEYSFTGLPAGAYTVTISDYPDDVTFSSTSKAATIQTNGQSVTVDFSGSYIRTSSIIGSVTAGGTGVAGVSVAATGPSGTTQNKVSGANGNFAFTGLRAGTYTIEISNIPAGFNFPTTTQQVTVAAGATENAAFQGSKAQDEVTATVVIQSVKLNNGDNANPAAIQGQINVTLGIEPGTNQLSQICVLIDGAEVPNGCQSLGSGAVAPQGPEAAATFEPTFTILTDAAADGAPAWLNGNHTLSARLDLTNATEANVTTSMQLTFANTDKLDVSLVADGNQANSSNGKIWHSGKATVTATPLLYSGGTISQVTFQLRAVDGGADDGMATGTNAVTDKEAPFTATWPTSGAASSTGNVGAVTGPVYAIVSASTLASGTAGPTSPAGVPAESAANFMNLDNVAPPAPSAWDVAVDYNHWAGMPYLFKSDAPSKPADPTGSDGTSVGGVTCAFHAGDAGSDPADLLAEAAVTAGTDLAESLSNTEYDAIYNCWDALKNGENDEDAATVADNPFGVDLTAPTNVKYVAGSPADEAILAGGEQYALQGQDALSGPFDTFGTLQLFDADGDTNCIVGDDSDDTCERVSNVLDAPFTTTATVGYWTFEGAFRDNARNEVEAPDGGRMAIFDNVDPSVGNVVLPSSLPSGGSASFSAMAEDNLDLRDFTTRTIYANGMELPYSAPTMISGAVFGPPLIQESAMAQSVNFIRSLEDFSALGTLYAATGQMFTARDWALNSSSNFNNFAAGTVPPGSSASALGVNDWYGTKDPADLCVGSADDCGDTPDATDLDGVAKGLSGSFAAPFSRVIFYRVDGGVYTFVGETSSRLSDDNGVAGDPVGRTWTYSGVTFTATEADAGTVNFIVVGVDSQGDGLIRGVITVNVVVP